MRSKLLVLAAVIAALAPAKHAFAQERAGVASAVTQTARGQVGGGSMRTIRIGKSVFSGERITTDARGRVQVLLADGSNFVVGPNSSLVIDEFVYRPEQGAGKIVATFGRGVARYVGGRISKNRGGVTIRTRQGTIGVRGGMANLVQRGDDTVFSFLFGKDLTFTGRNGREMRVYRSGFSVFASGGQGRVGRTPANLQNLVTRQLTGTGGAGPRPNAEQLRRLGFANSALPPAPGSPIPPPVIISRGVPVPGNRLDRNFANGSRIGYPPTPGCVSPLYC